MVVAGQKVWWTWLAGILALAFLAFFFSEKLYSTGSDDATRLTRGELLVWMLSPSTAETPSPLAGLTKNLTPVSEFAARLPFLAVAMLTWILAIMMGRLLLWPFVERDRLTYVEWWLFCFGVGMAALALIAQILGLAGFLDRHVFLIIGGVISFCWGIRTVWRAKVHGAHEVLPRANWSLVAWTTLCALPILLLALFASMLPTPDYDAHAYHLLAPKEWFHAGRIRFLPHNVYASFPFLMEMFPLIGMTLFDDWFRGALAGQTILAGYGFASAIGVGLLARRLFGTHAGWLAGMVYASIPWTYRLSSIPYVEGGMIFYFVAGLLALERFRAQGRAGGLVGGLMMGASFGCKYTALFMVVVPCLLVGFVSQRERGKFIGWFVIGFALMAGIWLTRNAFGTGNPVYPLAYSWFGGLAWNDELAERFRQGHSSTEFSVSGMMPFLRDIVSRSDWQSGLLFAFVPLAFVRDPRRSALITAGIVYIFFVFYFATHRLDRFFLTLQPLAALLAGAGLATFRTPILRALRVLIVSVCVFFNVILSSTSLGGMNMYAAPLAKARGVALEAVAPSLARLNASDVVKDDDAVLFVGLAAVFESRPIARYNTVFNKSLLEELLRSADPSKFLTPAEKRQALRAAEIDYVFVDWTWIERYRSPGNYGFTPFIQQSLFEDLVTEKVLRRVALGTEPAAELYEVLGEGAID